MTLSIHKVALIGFVLAIVGGALLMTWSQYKLEKWVDTRYQQHLNTEFIIESDTLTIINYSVLQDNFTLSDGQNISAEIVNQEIDK